MLHRSKWHGWLAASHHFLGLAYYLHAWYVVIGIGSLLSAVLVQYRMMPVLLASIGSVACVSGLQGWITASMKRRGFLNPDLVFTRLDQTYSTTDWLRYHYDLDIVVRARRAGVSTIRRKFKWTGDGTVSASVVGDLVATHHIESGAPYDVIHIVLKRPLGKRETAQFDIAFELEDVDHRARPFFRRYVDDHFENGFSIKIQLPETPSRAQRSILASPSGGAPIWTDSFKPKERTLSWRVTRPRIDSHYELSWQQSLVSTASVKDM
jgi:hypothetical protein